MLMGAAIGAVVGLVFYFVRQSQEKKAQNDQSDILDNTENKD